MHQTRGAHSQWNKEEENKEEPPEVEGWVEAGLMGSECGKTERPGGIPLLLIPNAKEQARV